MARQHIDVTIRSGQSLSDVADFYGHDQAAGHARIVGLRVPASFEGTVLTFQSSSGDETGPFDELSTGTSEDACVTIPSAPRLLALDEHLRSELDALCQSRYFKIRSGLSSAPVTVAADRTIRVFMEV